MSDPWRVTWQDDCCFTFDGIGDISRMKTAVGKELKNVRIDGMRTFLEKCPRCPQVRADNADIADIFGQSGQFWTFGHST
jgi:hypothetical protein